jgi:mono/diheme cytochrome c family protein
MLHALLPRPDLAALLLMLGIACVLPGSDAAAQPADELAGEAGVEYFERHVRPVFAESCYGCHSDEATDLKGGLRLDSMAGWQRGSDSGPILDTANPDASLLLRVLRHDESVAAMPPDQRLSDEAIEKIRIWMEAGAPGPAENASGTGDSSPRYARHWSFQLPVTPPLAAVRSSWGHNRLDGLLEDHQLQKGLRPAAAAEPAVLVRRLFQDLHGLPPTFEQVEAFVADPGPAAFDQLVDQLLASPRFGERWTRPWLDVARYADTKGYLFMEERNYKDAYRFRDWVIHSFNEDLGYDEFLKYQLAADRLAPDRSRDLAAMGFLTLGRRFLNNQHDIIDDRIDVVSRGLMGLTVTCARCHSHKFDPIPIEDYYSLYGVFANSVEPGDEPSPLRMVDRPEPVSSVVFIRGNPGRPGAEVPRQFLGFLAGSARKPFANGSGRLDLAEAIASEANPLTARVLVNRVWGRLMGRYLVDTPSDFGLRSDPPELQALLDELAVSFQSHDWSMKWLVRSIVRSAAYRQSAQADPAILEADPENRSCTRMERKRLDFEGLRDNILAASGQLRLETLGGPSEDIAKAEGSTRRSLYAFIDRQNLPGVFRTFDMANPDTHAPKRYETTVPQQALYLLNSPFAWRASAALAQDVQAIEGASEDRIRWLYRRVLGRSPSADETARATEFLGSDAPTEVRTHRWKELAQVLLVCNEFAFVD